MKKIHLTIWTLTVLLFAACDNVPLDERLTYVEPPEVGRAVLIEDYTGQHCVNCPRATEEIERLVEEYGDSVVIAVAIHSGPFSKEKDGSPTPLYTEVGNRYFTRWGLSAQPVGLVDRLYGPMAFSYTDWGDGVHQEIGLKAPVSLSMLPSYDNETRNSRVEVQTIGLDSVRVAGKLQVWLVEDSIDSFQFMPNGLRNEHYNHMHVFRASINDPWGDDVSVDHGQVAMKTYEFKLDPAWVPEHCAFVVFLYDDNGVKQVAKKKLIDY